MNGDDKPKKKKKRLSVYDTFEELPLHAETVYDLRSNTSRWCIYNRETKKITYANSIRWANDNETYYPQDGGIGGLLERKTILLPSEAQEYQDEDSLLAEIEGFIRTYMVLPEEFYLLASHYVLLSWIGDCFTAVPYLRARGDTGSGKSRFLQVVGSLSYCGVFASGATTASPIFRIYDMFPRATFLFDEADWSNNRDDEFAEVIKILNVGYQKGQSVLRSEKDGNDIAPRAFDVFGPKILGTRNIFGDTALESRCFTIGLRMQDSLQGVPENVGTSFWKQAEDIRNKLLMWRFRRFKIYDEIPQIEGSAAVSHRLRMIMPPMILTREHQSSKEELIGYLTQLETDVRERRSMDMEAVILAGVLDCLEDQGTIAGLETNVPIIDVMHKVNADRDLEGEEKVTARKIHQILKTRLNVQVKRVAKKFTIIENSDYLKQLAAQFGLDSGYTSSNGVPEKTPDWITEKMDYVEAPAEPD
jgi:hypothetical protein